MAPPQQIIVKLFNAGVNAQAWRLLNGTTLSSQLDSDIVTIANETTSTVRRRANAFLEFRDRGHTNIWRQDYFLTSSGGSWTAGGADNNVQENQKTGLHLIHPNGIPTIAFLYRRRTTGDMHHRTMTSTTFSSSAPIRTNPGGPNGIGIAVPYRDALFWCFRVNGVITVASYDFTALSWTDYNFANFSSSSADDLVVHKNRLFWVGVIDDSTTANYQLRIQDGASFNVAATLSDVEMGTSKSGGGPCMFTDPATGDLIAIIPGNNTSPVPEEKVIRIQSATTSPTVSDITSSTQLAIYQAGGGSVSSTSTWYCHVDVDTSPTSPVVYLYRLSGPGHTGGSWKAYQWNGISSTMTDLGAISAAFDNDFVVSHRRYGGGNISPAQIDGASRVAMEGNPIEEAGGLMKREFRVWGTGPVINAKVYFSPDEQAPNTEATLSSIAVESGSPATTPTLSSNTINNITPDDGATLYSFTWRASLDGITEGQGYTLMMDTV